MILILCFIAGYPTQAPAYPTQAQYRPPQNGYPAQNQDQRQNFNQNNAGRSQNKPIGWSV